MGSWSDPPFYQRETDSSNEDLMRMDLPPRLANHPFAQVSQGALARPTVTHSSSADDFRSVIDDLTIENKRLKEELRRYKQFGPDLLRKEKLFEIKVHGLPRHKKRELEATLRSFAANLEGSSDGPSQRKRLSKTTRKHTSGGTVSKHASSSSSQSRPVDSAYASMSAGNHSFGTSLGRQSVGSRARSSEQKVEHYLQEIPEGLHPGYMPPALPDRERKKLVVKKLEQLFTGKITGHNLLRNQPMGSMGSPGAPAVTPPSPEMAREAYIQQDTNRKKGRSHDNLSTSHSNSNADQTESGGNGNGSRSGSGRGAGNNGPSTDEPAPEQRPTRPRDLDPDRVQVPSENMDYIRHLGLVAPELLVKPRHDYQDVSPDAEGWVYLNLLCNLAQLHILNVGPDFIRNAVSEKSTKFQLSPDGRKIRWRGGSEGTKFSSDSSGGNSQPSPSTDGDDGSDQNGQRKKQKTDPQGADFALASSKNHSKFGPQISGLSGGFHYKPLFIHRTSLVDMSIDETGSQDSSQVEDSLAQNSRWEYSGSGSSPRKKRRADGAIVFYSGAPFCTDLSGDIGGTSPTTYLTSTGREEGSATKEALRSKVGRSLSGSSVPFRPVKRGGKVYWDGMVVDGEAPGPTAVDDDDDDDDATDLDGDFPWCDDPEKVGTPPPEHTLEPSGIGRVFPEDHFRVVVTTRRPCKKSRSRAALSRPRIMRTKSNDTTTTLVNRLECLSASSQTPNGTVEGRTPAVEIEYLSGQVKRLKPVPLPPPALFYPPFTSSSDSEADGDALDSEDDDVQGEKFLSQRVHPYLSDNTYPDDEDLISGDEEDEVDDLVEMSGIGPGPTARKQSAETPFFKVRARRCVAAEMRGKSADLVPSGSSVATAGGVGSGYNSNMEDE